MFLQKWWVLQREADQSKIKDWAGQVKRWMGAFLEEIKRRSPEDLFI